MTDIVIFILGGGTMQLPAIKYANEMGWVTIVADGNKFVPGRKISRYFENIDLKDTEGIINIALEYKKKIGLNGVFTAGTDFSELVARVADTAGLPGITIESAVKASNKFKMRQALKKHGVNSPGFVSFKSLTNVNCKELELKNIIFPVVVKPVDNMGSRGIKKVKNCDQLGIAVSEAFKFSRSGRVIIEEYLHGPEFSVDAIIYKGNITICGFADRHIYYPPYFIEMGHTIPSNLDNQRYLEIIATFKSAVNALGITEGTAKGDIKYSRGKAYVGEIAARLSGGYMSGWTYPYSSGVELTKEALKIAVGQEPGNLNPILDRTTAERAFISIPGHIKQIYGLEEIKSDFNIKNVFLRVSPGDNVKFPENNVEKAGNCIAVNELRETAVQSAENACRKIFIRLESCNEITEKFLFDSYQSWVPNAFKLNNPVNIKKIENMLDYKIHSMDSIKIISIPFFLTESTKEWHGKTISAALNEILSVKYNSSVNMKVQILQADKTKAQFDAESGILLGKVFYTGLLRGGVQGGVWIIDSILRTIDEKKSLMELFDRWKSYS